MSRNKEAMSVEDTSARSAMKLALEALYLAVRMEPSDSIHECPEMFQGAITALRNELAKQEQGEPLFKSIIEKLAEELAAMDKEPVAEPHKGEPDEEVLGFNGWGFPIQHPSKQKHDDPAVYSKEQIKIYAEANYDAGYTTGYMDASVKAHDKKTTPVVWVHSDELGELSHCNGMSVWAENAQVHTEDSITNQLIPSGYLPLYTTPQKRPSRSDIKPLTDEQINAISDEYLVDYRIPAGCALNFARDVEAAHGIKE